MDKEQIKWFIQVFIMTFILSMLFSYISANGVSNLSLIPAILILILVIGIGIFFDIIGVAVTVANEEEFHAKATKKVAGSKNSIKLIKNGENVVTKYDSETHTYKEYLSRDIEQVSLSIEANNMYTTITSGETTGTPIISINNISVKDQEEVDVKVTAIAETGRTQQYTIKLLRKSKNADASHIYVDNTDIIDRFVDKDSVPTSIISIPKEKDLATIKVISANEYASIKIGDTEELTENVTRNIKLPLEDGTITVQM